MLFFSLCFCYDQSLPLAMGIFISILFSIYCPMTHAAPFMQAHYAAVCQNWNAHWYGSLESEPFLCHLIMRCTIYDHYMRVSMWRGFRLSPRIFIRFSVEWIHIHCMCIVMIWCGRCASYNDSGHRRTHLPTLRRKHDHWLSRHRCHQFCPQVCDCKRTLNSVCALPCSERIYHCSPPSN